MIAVYELHYMISEEIKHTSNPFKFKIIWFYISIVPYFKRI